MNRLLIPSIDIAPARGLDTPVRSHDALGQVSYRSVSGERHCQKEKRECSDSEDGADEMESSPDSAKALRLRRNIALRASSEPAVDRLGDNDRADQNQS